MLSRRSDAPGSDADTTEPDNGRPGAEIVVLRDNGDTPEVGASAALVAERDELRAQVSRLEAELARHRAQEEPLQKTLHLAAVYAARIREDARRDAHLALRKARERADETLGGLRREKTRLEQELVHLRQVTDETRSVLATFLASAVEGLRTDAEETGSPPEPESGIDRALQAVLADGQARRDDIGVPRPPERGES